MIPIKTAHTSAHYIIHPRLLLGFGIEGNNRVSVRIGGVGIAPLKSNRDAKKAREFCMALFLKIAQEPERHYVMDDKMFEGL